MTQSNENDKSYWSIETDYNKPFPKMIHNSFFDIPFRDDVYNYNLYTPIVLIPISKSSAFILSSYTTEKGKLGMKLHDLRIVDNQMVASLSMTIRGSEIQLKRIKNDFNRNCDDNKCVGISFFFRKLHYGGFSTIYADKTLRSKPKSSLRATMNVLHLSNKMNQEEETHD